VCQCAIREDFSLSPKEKIMTKVNAIHVVGFLAGLGVLTGGGIWVNRLLMPGSVPAQAQTNQQPQSGQEMSGMSGMTHHNQSSAGMSDMEHGNMSPAQAGPRATAQLNVKGPVSPGQSFPLTITIKDPQGQPVKDFQITQEKLMHLIVVSNNLGFYEHIHPTFTGNGQFEISTALPQPGQYMLFSDFKPVGMSHQVTALPLSVAGTPTAANPQVNLEHTKTFGPTRVNLSLSNPNSQSVEPTTLVAGQEVKVTFDLKDTATGRSVSNLQPYLGTGGHLVILRQSPQLTAANYIHAHALPLASTTSADPGQVSFLVAFPQAGHYKLWGQFSRGGQIVTADFWVDVKA